MYVLFLMECVECTSCASASMSGPVAFAPAGLLGTLELSRIILRTLVLVVATSSMGRSWRTFV